MAQVKSQGNRTTEMRMVSLFRRYRITGWRRQYHLRGKPDFVFPRRRVVVFVDGCFWHGCPRHGRMPSSRAQYWESKIARNKARDRTTTHALREMGWRVVRVWEHELRKDQLPRRLITVLQENMRPNE